MFIFTFWHCNYLKSDLLCYGNIFYDFFKYTIDLLLNFCASNCPRELLRRLTNGVQSSTKLARKIWERDASLRLLVTALSHRNRPVMLYMPSRTCSRSINFQIRLKWKLETNLQKSIASRPNKLTGFYI